MVCNPETPLSASSTDDDPMSLHHDDDTPPWVYQEPETPWISTEQDTQWIIPQQVPSPPIQVSPSTGGPIIPHPPWFDETSPPPSTTHEDVLPPAPSFGETPSLKTAQVPETPTIPSVAKRWRSGALHQVPETPTIPSVAKRWRSGTLHLENPATPSQLRWRAGVLRALRPFRRLQDKQSSERVKRPRLTPAQINVSSIGKGL